MVDGHINPPLLHIFYLASKKDTSQYLQVINLKEDGDWSFFSESSVRNGTLKVCEFRIYSQRNLTIY